MTFVIRTVRPRTASGLALFQTRESVIHTARRKLFRPVSNLADSRDGVLAAHEAGACLILQPPAQSAAISPPSPSSVQILDSSGFARE